MKIVRVLFNPLLFLGEKNVLKNCCKVGGGLFRNLE
jgi:hypothetical protein